MTYKITMNYLQTYWKVIPCYKCSINYKRLDELPIDTFLTTKMKLFEWTVYFTQYK
jgi:hypothetical protein